MIWFDYVLLGIIGLSTLVSLVRGFIKEAVSLAVWLGALFLSSQYFNYLTPYLTGIADPLVKNGAAIAILFVATLIAGALVNYLLSQLVQVTGLSGTDRALGAVFGALRGVLICATLIFVLDTFTPASSAVWWQQSQLLPEFGFIIDWFFKYMQDSSSLINPQS